MNTNPFSDQYNHYINQLITELHAFDQEEQIWSSNGLIKNSPGVLVKHIIGNLNHFIGFGLGYTDYQRDRPAEFSETRLSVLELVNRLEETRKLVLDILQKETDLNKPVPGHLFKREITLGYYLSKLSTHLAYHVGQINYYRRGINN